MPSIPSGESGDLSINTEELRVMDEALLTARSDGTGNAGQLKINANNISLDNGGEISASTASGEGGNININTDNLELLDQSQITASARGMGDGGNITIDSNTILGIENSDITANAIGGDGGNITISSDFIVGLQERSQLTSFNDITATSEFGIDGTVTINNPDSNFGKEAVVVFGKYTPPGNRKLLERTCLNPSNPKNRKLVYVGRSGIPENPDNFFGDEDVVAVETIATDEHASENLPLWVEGDPIIDSNAVRIGADGKKYLVAEVQMEDANLGICTRTAND